MERDEQMELNCPNCGAPLGFADKCEYCGTWVADFTMDIEKPFYIRIRSMSDLLMIDRVRLVSATVNYSPNNIMLYADNTATYTMSSPDVTYNIELQSLGVQK